jgi:SPP1 gp7 family putative phage head morphogenesis protein
LKPLLDVLADLTRDLEREWPQPEPVRTDAERDIERLIARTSERFAKAIRAQSVTPIASKYAEATSDFQRAQLAKQARAAVSIDVRKLSGVDRNVPRQIAQFAETNAQLITGLGQRMADDIAEIVEEGVVSGSRWETIAKRLEHVGGVTESRAALIARDQVGKLYADINRQRQGNLGVTRYVWRTVRDNRVREEHESLDGESFDWGAPPPDGHPGEAVNCRCYADPDFSDLLG